MSARSFLILLALTSVRANAQAPDGWLCNPTYFQDGSCDCGCGVADDDCGIDGCTVAGCAHAGCEYCYVNEAAAAAGDFVDCSTASEGDGEGEGEAPPAPPEWLCPTFFFGSDDGCDCGCGAVDLDCGDSGCAESGCSAPSCELCYNDRAAAEAGDGVACGGGEGEGEPPLGCLVDDDCDARERCEQGSCVAEPGSGEGEGEPPAGEGEGEPPAGEGEGEAPALTCGIDADCGGGGRCVEGTCVRDESSNARRCVLDAECEARHICVDGSCVADPEAEPPPFFVTHCAESGPAGTAWGLFGLSFAAGRRLIRRRGPAHARFDSNARRSRM